MIFHQRIDQLSVTFHTIKPFVRLDPELSFLRKINFQTLNSVISNSDTPEAGIQVLQQRNTINKCVPSYMHPQLMSVHLPAHVFTPAGLDLLHLLNADKKVCQIWMWCGAAATFWLPISISWALFNVTGYKKQMSHVKNLYGKVIFCLETV